MAGQQYLANIGAICLLCLMVSSCDSTLKPSHSLEVAAKGLHSGALSEDGRFIVAGSIYHGASLWSISDEKRLFNWNHSAGDYTTVIAADISADGQWAVTANPQTLVLWNTRDGTGDRYWRAPGEILDVAIGPDANKAILGLSDHSAVIFDIRRGGVTHTFEHNNRVRSVDLSEDGRYAITGSEDFTANLWDLRAGEKLSTIKHEDDVQLVQLSPNGSFALSVSKYDKALMWDTSKREIIGIIPLQSEHLKRGIRFLCARFNSNSTLLATGRSDRIVELWDVATLSRVAKWTLPKRHAWKPTGAAALSVSFDPEGSRLYALASNGFVHTLTIP